MLRRGPVIISIPKPPSGTASRGAMATSDLPAVCGRRRTGQQPGARAEAQGMDVRSRSLVIHAGGDNYADHPAPPGGGPGGVRRHRRVIVFAPGGVAAPVSSLSCRPRCTPAPRDRATQYQRNVAMRLQLIVADSVNRVTTRP